MRRSWLKEVVNVTKRYLIAAAAHNLGRILRKLFGVGKPRALQGLGGLIALAAACDDTAPRSRSHLTNSQTAQHAPNFRPRPRKPPTSKTTYFPGLLGPRRLA